MILDGNSYGKEPRGTNTATQSFLRDKSPSRHNAALTVNAEITALYWHIGHRIKTGVLSGERARDSGGAIAPTTIHTFRKATVFGRIAAESPPDLHKQIR
jgi:hypothetical protein